MNENNESQTPEFSYQIEMDKIPTRGRHVKLQPNAAELTLMTHRFGVLAFDAVKASLHVKPLAGGQKVHITGVIEADVTQACVINLSPVFSKIKEEFHLVFAPPSFIGHDMELSLDDDAYEPILNGFLDLGEIVAQQLSLAIDPYPRSKSADLKAVQQQTSGKNGPKFHINEKSSPFAILKNLKEKN